MMRLNVFGLAFVMGVWMSGCKDEPGEATLKCGANERAVEICCVGDGDESCYDACAPLCETDEDCDLGDVCNGGACEPNDDCS